MIHNLVNLAVISVKILMSNTYSNCYVHLSIWLSLAGYRKIRVATNMVRDEGKWPVPLVSLRNVRVMASPLLCLATESFPEWALEKCIPQFWSTKYFTLRPRFRSLESSKRKWLIDAAAHCWASELQKSFFRPYMSVEPRKSGPSRHG
jgi:hypothetical protein